MIKFSSCRKAYGVDTLGLQALTHLCPPLLSTFAVRETASLGQQMLNAPLGINGLKSASYVSCAMDFGGLSESWV